MSDNDMKTTVRVDSVADTSGIDKMLAKIKEFQSAINKMGRNTAKGLNDGLAESVKRAQDLGSVLSKNDRTAAANQRRRLNAEKRIWAQSARETEQAAKAETAASARVTSAKLKDAAVIERAARRDEAARFANGARELRAKIAGEQIFAREQVKSIAAAERARATADRAAMMASRSQLAFAERMGRQREQEARDLGRVQASAARQAEQERAKAVRGVAGGAGRVRQGVGRATAVGAVGAAVVGASARRGLDRLTQSGIGIDDALTQAQIHVFGSLPASEARKSAEALRKRIMPIATKLGSKTADLVGAYVEASQAGVDSDILDKVTELGSKYAKMNKLSLPTTLEETGYALQGLKAFGQVTDKTVGQYFNKMSYLVATTAANRTQMSSFGKRGLAAGASVGMSIDDTLAFGAAATAAGAEGNQASRMLSSQGGRIAGWGMKARDLARKSHKTDEQRLFLEAPRLMGLGNYQNLATKFRTDFLGTFAEVQTGLKRITDPLKRRSIEKMLFGQEFGAITDSMVMGGNLREYRNKLKSPEANNFIDQNWSKQTGSFGFIVDQIKAVFQNLSDSLGLALKPIYSDLRDFAVQLPAAFSNFEDTFRVGLKGFMSGLGSPDGTMAGLLGKWFGDPAAFKLNVTAVGDYARGFGAGLKDVAEGIRRFFSVFTGSDASSESMGRWTGRFLALSAALVVASPAITLLGALGTAILGFGTILRSASTILAGAGVGGLAARIVGGIGLGIVAEIGANRGAIATWLGAPQIGSMLWDGIKEFLSGIGASIRKMLSVKGIVGLLKSGASELVPAPIERYLNGADPAQKALPSKALEGAFRGVSPLQKAIEDNTAIQKQSFDASQGLGLGSLIQKANLESGVGGMGARVQLAALGGLNSAAIARAAGSGTVGAAMGAVGIGSSALGQNTPGRAFSIPGVGSRFGVGGSRGSGGGGGAGASDNSPIAPVQGKAFGAVGPRIMADLQKDFGLSKVQAASIVGNLGHESAGFSAFQEKNPRGGRGGWGYAQWTGPRRRQFEAWAQAKGLDPKSYEANYGFLRHELQTSERGGIAAVKRQNTLEGGTAAFERSFERAGVVALGSRLKWAKRAQSLPDVAAGVTGPDLRNKAKDALGGKPGTYGKQDPDKDILSSTGWKKASDLAKESPAESLARKAPGVSDGAGAGGKGPSIHAPINVHGATDPEKTAQAVSRHLNDVQRYQTTDSSFQSI